jgi:hypothetical protein
MVWTVRNDVCKFDMADATTNLDLINSLPMGKAPYTTEVGAVNSRANL